MTVPQKLYGDPLEVMLRAEAESCKGCIHREVSGGGMRERCTNPNVKSVLADHRCDEYEDGSE